MTFLQTQSLAAEECGGEAASVADLKASKAPETGPVCNRYTAVCRDAGPGFTQTELLQTLQTSGQMLTSSV